MRKYKRLQDWERTAIIEAYKAGEKVEALVAEFDLCSPDYPGKLARRAGYPLRSHGRPASDKRIAYHRRQMLVRKRQQERHV